MKERRNIILNMYFVEKLRPVDIAKKLDISKSAVTQVLRKDKRYIQIKQEKKIKNQKKHIEETKEYIKEKHKKPGNVYLGLVHMLNRPVGGIMIFAKTSKAAGRLSEQVRNKTFKKKYLAVVDGKIDNKKRNFRELLI